MSVIPCIRARIILTIDRDSDLRRWNANSNVPFYLPSWDWTNNKGMTDLHLVRFPRVLVHAANDTAVAQPVDGNLGLAVPGYIRCFATLRHVLMTLLQLQKTMERGEARRSFGKSGELK